MKRRILGRLLLIGIPIFLCTGGMGACAIFGSHDVAVAVDDPPKVPPQPVLQDDKVEDKKTAWDPSLVDRRPLGEWLINTSEAPLELDIDTVLREKEATLADLHKSYAEAVAASRGGAPTQPTASVPSGPALLPSVNLIDGKAKQFDDGLYAALDQAYYTGLNQTLQSHVGLIRRMFDAVGPNSPAAPPFLAAGLELAGEKVSLPNAAARAEKDKWLRDFTSDPSRSRPIAFYVWNSTLGDCFRFLRFFQHEFADLTVPQAIAQALDANPSLRADYRRALDFYARLTDPFPCLSCDELVGGMAVPNAARLAEPHRSTVALFPPSASRDTELFRKLFPAGLPPDADLMRELITRIRSGQVNLKPRENSGWYDYQAYALEALVLPEKAEGAQKLVLTRNYKERSLEAFRALLTKRRETHVRQMESVGCAKEEGDRDELSAPDSIKPRLRLEPSPGYYLRTARAYAYLSRFLDATIGEQSLRSLHGLTETGLRPADLYTELHFMRDLFYGLYLVDAEDIGLAPELTPDEAERAEACYSVAADWLPKALDDPDLSADTRVAVPVYVDPVRGRTRLWVTLGVRTAKLRASYADASNRPPRLKRVKAAIRAGTPSTEDVQTQPTEPSEEWAKAEPWRLGTARYLIFGDEFAEVEINSLTPPTRAEFRAICDQYKTRDAILNALSLPISRR